MTCLEFEEHYTGETELHRGDSEKTRHKNKKQPLSAVSALNAHKQQSGHQCFLKDASILDYKENWFRKKMKEAIDIHRCRSIDTSPCLILILQALDTSISSPASLDTATVITLTTTK